jgi:hypothetical protein
VPGLVIKGKWTMQDAPTTRDATTGVRPSAETTGASHRSAKDRLLHEVTRFGVMFVYLWLVFGLFVLLERIIRGQMGIGYQSQGFALINALVLAKVMLVAEDLNLDRGVGRLPLVYAVLGEAFLFMIVFIAFHVLERLAVGLLHGSSLADSVPAFGGGGFAGLMTVAAIMFVVLTPYFAFRDISRALGPGEMRRLLFSRRGTIAALH